MIAALSAAVLLLSAGSTPSPTELPSIERLFSCPLELRQESFTPPEVWVSVEESRSGVSVEVPPTWTVDKRPHRLEVIAPDKSIRVSVRHSARQGDGALAHARRSLEVSELGLPFVKESCASRVVSALKNEAPWTAASFGYYGRPLGERRRRVAFYASLTRGSVAVVISTRWPRGQSGPDWPMIWALLGGIREGASPTTDQVAFWNGPHLH